MVLSSLVRRGRIRALSPTLILCDAGLCLSILGVGRDRREGGNGGPGNGACRCGGGDCHGILGRQI